MAAQTDAPDDLIAELARLMADDAKVTPPAAREQSTPVRIPGDVLVAPVVPGPRFDFSASGNLASSRAPASPVRIPGGENAKPATGEPVEPFAFNFDITPTASAPVSAAPVAREPAPAAPRAPEPAPAPAREEPGLLDQDSLADLIAAELAADLGGDRAPEAQAPVAPERSTGPDNFGVPPVFGLASSPPATGPTIQPRATAPVPVEAVAPAPVPTQVEASSPESESRRDDEAMDPLEEIERLIGPAVRMNSATTSPTPALRSLATPLAVEPEPVIPQVRKPEPQPRVATPAPEPAVHASSVDEAILAAAAATGAHVEWVNSGAAAAAADPDDYEAEPLAAVAPARGFRLSRAVAGPLVAVGLLAIAGFGLYWVLGQSGGVTGPAPLLVADTTPTKEVPEVDTTASAQQSVVFNEISGEGAGVEEQIVSRDQADTEAVVAANAPVSSSGVIDDGSGASIDPNQDGLVNRKVRTVTVRPDGTIVSGDDSMAGSTILPVDRPNVPEVPGADFSTPDLIASVTAEADAAAATAPVEPAAAPSAPVAEPGAVISVVDASGAPVAGRSVTVPVPRPADFAALSASAIAAANAAPALAPQPAAAPVAATTPVAATPAPAAPAAATTPGTASAYVQLASQRSEADAQATVQAITTRYGVLFGGAAPEIRRVDLGERGIFYRVLVPAASRDDAANICTNVRAAGGDCLLL
jgi:hypothetical protein